MVTGDAQRNVDFYAGVLGLRFIKKTVNFDQPEAYHLYFGDEQGSPGSVLTWFVFPGIGPGRAGAGMIHRLDLAVASRASLDFWQHRLRGAGHESVREDHSLLFEDYDGLALGLIAHGADGDRQLRARHPEIPDEHAISGVVAARAYVPQTWIAEPHPLLTETLGFAELAPGHYRLDGELRAFEWIYEPTAATGTPGAGCVHHIAWACRDEDQPEWEERVRQTGANVTPIIDRDYFTSIYFREPRHVLFEIATLGPGFAVDEDPEHLGEELRLPVQHEPLRAQLERTLAPLRDPRAPLRDPRASG